MTDVAKPLEHDDSAGLDPLRSRSRLPTITVTPQAEILSATGTDGGQDTVCQNVVSNCGANCGARTTIVGQSLSGSVQVNTTAGNEKAPVNTGALPCLSGSVIAPAKMRHLGLEPKTR